MPAPQLVSIEAEKGYLSRTVAAQMVHFGQHMFSHFCLRYPLQRPATLGRLKAAPAECVRRHFIWSHAGTREKQRVRKPLVHNVVARKAMHTWSLVVLVHACHE